MKAEVFTFECKKAEDYFFTFECKKVHRPLGSGVWEFMFPLPYPCAGKLLQSMSWRTFEDMCQLSCSIEGFLGHSWGSLGRSWALLGSSWGTLVASWGALGALLGALGALLGGLGSLLERSWIVLGLSCGDLGPS